MGLTFDQQVRLMIGDLFVSHAQLKSDYDALTEHAAQLKAELDARPPAPVSPPAAPNGDPGSAPSEQK
jgi:hypothetical protein